jgi:hypothetical protein
MVFGTSTLANSFLDLPPLYESLANKYSHNEHESFEIDIGPIEITENIGDVLEKGEDSEGDEPVAETHNI